MFVTDGMITFFITAVLLILTPGPDMVYILTRTVSQGRSAGVLSSVGICTGAMVHVLAAAIGLSAILSTSAIAFSIVKYAGAAYLIWLGIRALMSSGTQLQVTNRGECRLSKTKVFFQGVLIDVLNPKVAIFFMAFLPQFVDPARGSVFWQLLGLGSVVVAIALVTECGIVLAAGLISDRIRENRSFSKWMDRVSGVVLIGLGLRLAQQER
jgi:RhtB (resistance to homoserine/threonine) family protein